MARRPFALYAIVILLLINAVLTALDVSHSYVSLGLELGLPRSLPGLYATAIDQYVRYAVAAGIFIVAIGILTLRRGAWSALMIMIGIGLAENILRYVRGEPRYSIMFFNVLIVLYLNQHSVQALFQRTRSPVTST